MVSKRWSWLAGFALLFAGITNAHSHVHYCFDGQEPPAAVHLVDDARQAPCNHAKDCSHVDVDVPNPALAKAVKYDPPAIDVVAWTMPIESSPVGTLVEIFDSPAYSNPRYALPQLRAPPR